MSAVISACLLLLISVLPAQAVHRAVHRASLAARAPARTTAEAPAPTMAQLRNLATERVHDAIAQISARIEALTDQFAGDYIAYLEKAGQVLDAEKISKPEHREYFLTAGRDTLVRASLTNFDSFAVALRAAVPDSLSVSLARYLQSERDLLEDFLYEDPAVILKVMKRSNSLSPRSRHARNESASDSLTPRLIMAQTEEQAARGNFADRLRRAAPRGDVAIRRLVTHAVKRTTEPLANQMADGYVKFLVKMESVIDQQKVKDTDQRRALLVIARSAVTDSMMAEYDRYAAKMRDAFKGARLPIESAAAEVLDDEHDRIGRFFGSDPITILQIRTEVFHASHAPIPGRSIFRGMSESK